ncbi:MAG: type I DNA topoisomerase [Burkholderiales bacterium]|nr:type I DNA topoisomerase [Burkholderiales bacterium]
MGSTLFVIESPGKLDALRKILGPGFDVVPSFGHIRDLPEHDMGVAAPDYQPQYVVPDERTRATVDNLRRRAEHASRVILATDMDREGEAIAWHIADELDLRDAERVVYGEITPEAVHAALAHPRRINMARVDAQQARRVLDRFVGYEVSPALSDKVGQRLSAGRVQTPAVRLVVDRERAIRAFTPTHHFGAELCFGDTPGWKAQWVTAPFLAPGSEYLLDNELAAAAAAVRRVRVAEFADSTRRVPPPPPFTTSTLQQAAQARLKMKPTRTMEAAQALYERGAITYMRTDNPNLADAAYTQLVELFASEARPFEARLVAKKRTWKAKESAQEAHEAIRPTHFDTREIGDTLDEKILYSLIWTRAVASQMVDAQFAVRAATLEAIEPVSLRVGTPRPTYVARGKTLIDKGWKAVNDIEDSDESKDDDDESDNPIPALCIGVELAPKSGAVLSKNTKAPARYTLSTLGKDLEANGIGRPSTYAQILDGIVSRGYVNEDGRGFLWATLTAESIIDALGGKFGFVELDYTRTLEADLDEIADGRKSYLGVVAAAHQQLAGELARLGGPKHPCPTCGKPLRRRENKAKGEHFWGCSGYPTCTTTLPDDGGKPGKRAEKPAAAAPAGKPATAAQHTGGAMPLCRCGKPLRRSIRSAKDDPKGKGWDFWGCTGYPTCKQTYKPGPDGRPVIVERAYD